MYILVVILLKLTQPCKYYNRKFKTLTNNYSVDATSIQNFFVVNISSGIYDSKIPIIVAKNITIEMSQQELETALSGVNYEKEDAANFTYYNIHPTDSTLDGYTILVSNETSLVTKIELKYAPKFSEYTSR